MPEKFQSEAYTDMYRFCVFERKDAAVRAEQSDRMLRERLKKRGFIWMKRSCFVQQVHMSRNFI